jgi:hypothetical protein
LGASSHQGTGVENSTGEDAKPPLKFEKVISRNWSYCNACGEDDSHTMSSTHLRQLLLHHGQLYRLVSEINLFQVLLIHH